MTDMDKNIFQAMDTLRDYSAGKYVPLEEGMTAATRVVSLLDKLFKDSEQQEVRQGVVDYLIKLRIRVYTEESIQ